MTRRESRESAFQVVFEMSINKTDASDAIELAEETGTPELDGFSKNLIQTVYRYSLSIDESFKPYLKGWSVERISKSALAILRISCAQLFFWDEISDAPDGDRDEMAENIIINEAVELAKKFGVDDDYAFVNGVLGSVVRAGEAKG